jgi:signal peptidase II
MLQHIRNKGFIALAAAFILLDQCTKIAVKGFHLLGWKHDGMMLYESIPIVGDAVRLTFVENPGMAFGISFGAGKIFLSLFSVIASILLVWYLARLETPSFGAKLALTLIFAGATGNLIDRVFYGVFYGESPLFYGKVVDFVDVDMPDFALFGRDYLRFWVFNVADSCVSVGMGLMLLFNKHLPFLQDKPKRIQDTVAEQQTPPDAITTSNEAQ